ncbi:large-conductance mechanosensitive channel protein MscL [Sinimarinibacterium sp. NLF-5-8]|uniref:large-conductance mechanosensitive channel protein MscL n=1 Tax=Sinimarinibacterium sp. NLF-5-8 TaxID=2698684 RepID=UPI00137B9673|nr:large-conductance mechanosensitive channel protein MscL [Sinimarinibacterium sp. NLF-5-8]QHS09285.1 large-conductance mechanosensitive channel protein MscL [Sinimarinibacterium sp. NLF-5-8]
MSMVDEFKQFAMRGNVVDMAVGVIIGTAFGAIVSSLVGDVVMPIIGLLVGGIDFSEMALTLKAAQGDEPAVLLSYGKLVQATFDFLIVAFAIFMVIKGINKMQRKQAEQPAPEAPPEPGAEEKLLAEIRDLLKSKA